MRTCSPVRALYVCLTVAAGWLLAAPASAATISVAAGGNLQAAINAAAPGDVILLAPGATYTGSFVLPDKGATTAFITIRSGAADGQLPAEGVRITPAYASVLPKIRSSSTAPAMRTAASAHHWKLQFLEFLANVNGGGDVLDLGDGSSAQNTLSSVPHDLVVDRVYLHGDPMNGQKRGIGLNSASTWIVNCWISDVKAVGQDSQAIAGWNGPGPYTIENNYLEGAGNGFLIGGDDPKILNLIPSHIVFRRNTVSRPVSWQSPILAVPTGVSAAAITGGALAAGTYGYRVVARRPVGSTTAKSAPSATVTATVGASGAVTIAWAPVADAADYLVYGRDAANPSMYWVVGATTFTDTGAAGTAGTPPTSGTVWVVKNLFELKNASDVQVDGNLMENNWQQAQSGYAVLFTVRNQYGGCTWCVVEDVTFEYNTVRHMGAGFQVLGVDNNYPSQRTNNVRIRHNLFYDIDKTAWGGNGYFVLVADGPLQTTIDHNTIIQGSAAGVVNVYGTPAYGFVFTNNVSKHDSYGIIGQNYGVGNSSIAYYFPDGVITRNVLAGGNASQYPAGNLFPTVSDFQTQFLNYAGNDYRLGGGSPWIGAGTDAKDLGADLVALTAAGTVASPLAVTTTSLPDATTGNSYSATLQASGGAPPYQWAAVSMLPPGLALDPSSGSLGGMPTTGGTFDVQVQVTDARATSALATLTLVVTAAVPPLSITGTTTPDGTVGSPYAGAATATGGEPPYTWSITGTLPPGIGLDATAGTLSGTPAQAGTWTTPLSVADSGSPVRVASTSVSILVVSPLAIETTGLREATATVAYTATLTAIGGVAPYTWVMTSGSLPPGLALSSAGTVTGVPTSTGSWTAAVQVTDAGNRTATATYQFDVFNPLAITTTAVPSTTAGQAYSAALTASGGHSPYSWRLGSGALPPGIDLDPAGALSGTATTAGSWTVEVVADDAASPCRWAAQALTVIVAAAPVPNVPPTVTIVSPAGGQSFTLGTTIALAVNATDRDGAVARVEYFADGASIGVATSSPFGVGWRPAVAGSYSLTAVATDNAGASTTSAAVGITVAAPITPTVLPDVVLYAGDRKTTVGNYKLVSDSTAAAGRRLWNQDKGATTAANASALPKTYAEWTFQAQAGAPYRLWVRGKADKNRPNNDSAFVQFSDSVDGATAVYRIGTIDSTAVNIEDCTGCGLSGWGWQDNGSGVGVLGPTITFATTGLHTIRIQPREDGLSIDQIVLSPERFLTSSPGALKNDTTMVAKP